MMQVRWRGSQPEVTAWAESELPDLTTASPNRSEQVTAAVKEMLAAPEFIGRRVVTALPDADVRIKSLRLPQLPDDELEAAAGYEAAERFEFEESEAEYRFLPAGAVRSGDEPQQEVVALGVPADVIRKHLDFLSGMGLIAEAIDVVPCALFRPFERFLRRGEDADLVNAFVDLGFSGTRITVTRGQEIAFLKTLDIGGQHLDTLVSERLSIDPKEANRIRRTLANQETSGAGGPAEPVSPETQEAVRLAIGPAVDQLGKEIGLCLRYCAVTFRGPRCDSVTCVGGEANDIELLERLSERIGVPARKGYPLRNVTGGPARSLAEEHAGQPEWTTALGLALKPTTSSAERAA